MPLEAGSREPWAGFGGSGQPFEKWTRSIRHEKILIEPEHEALPSVRRYGASRPWPVGGLALVAASGAVLMAGTLSSVLEGGPDPAFAARIRQSVASAPPGIEAHASVPAKAVPAAASAPPPAGAWQVQVGAFRNAQAAEAHLRALESQVPELAKLTATHQLRGKIDRIRIAGIGDEAAARELCSRIAAVGSGCFVVRPGS